ncbi:MAG TPA: DUF1573 domain-containing protein [Thermoanaerobaculia bacterium]|nr:DUF1573 domain-containing protein [Thermoanaerobaculia bacterium]
MKRQVGSVILAVCAALVLGLTPLAYAAGAPKAVAVEPIKDIGTVAKSEKVVHDFVIKNEGDAVLEITQVRPACGCTVAEFDKTIAPGQTGKVHVVLDTSTFAGPIAKGVQVITNDPATPKFELTLRVKVEPYVSVKPGYARYIMVQGEDSQASIAQTLWVPDGTDIDVVKVDSPFPYMKTSFREAKPEERVADAKGKQWRVEMQLTKDAPVGAIAEYVTVHTTHPKQKLVQIPVSGFVRPVVAVTPAVADVGTVEVKQPLRRVLNVRNFATEPIKVTGVEGMKGVDVSFESLQDGREYQVTLVLKPELAKGPLNGKLKILTDSPKAPVIDVDVKGTVM